MAPPAAAAMTTPPPPELEDGPSVARASESIVFAMELRVGAISIASTLIWRAYVRVSGDAAMVDSLSRVASAIIGLATLMVVAMRTLVAPMSRETSAGEMPSSSLARLNLYDASSKEETSPATMIVKWMNVTGGGEGGGEEGGREGGDGGVGGDGRKGGGGGGGGGEQRLMDTCMKGHRVARGE